MNTLITIIRFPIGSIVVMTTTLYWISMFVVETVLAIVYLTALVIFANRSRIEKSWLAKYPQALPNIPRTCSAIWRWVVADSDESVQITSWGGSITVEELIRVSFLGVSFFTLLLMVSIGQWIGVCIVATILVITVIAYTFDVLQQTRAREQRKK